MNDIYVDLDDYLDDIPEDPNNTGRVDNRAHLLDDDFFCNKWWWKIADREADKLQSRRSFLTGSTLMTRGNGRK